MKFKPRAWADFRELSYMPEEIDQIEKDIEDTLGSLPLTLLRWMDRRGTDSEDDVDIMFSMVEKIIQARRDKIEHGYKSLTP